MKKNIKNLNSMGKLKIRKKTRSPSKNANPYFVLANQEDIEKIDGISSGSESLPRLSQLPNRINSPVQQDENCSRLLTMKSLDK